MNNRAILFLARKILWILALGVCSTLRIRSINASFFEKVKNSGKPYVIAFWHGSMLLGWYLHRPKKYERVSALVSQSKDGEILSSVLQKWGFSLIRGSSHVGGKEAMQAMVDCINGGNSLCVTPDGPTGPRQRMKMGAVRAAQRTGVPLILVGIAIRNKKVLHSWDRFEIPMMFSEVRVVYGQPVLVPEDLQGRPLDEFLASTEQQLISMNLEAEKRL